MAPSGQIKRQNGLNINADNKNTAPKRNSFHLNKNPIIDINEGLTIIRGKFASKTSTGQMYLQKAVLPYTPRAGSNKTKMIKMIYFKYSRLLNLPFKATLGKGILKINSWISPKGQNHPQTNRPKVIPTRSRNINIKNVDRELTRLAMPVCSIARGHEPNAPGQELQLSPGKQILLRGPL